MYCPNCGKEVKDTDNFCRYCGQNLFQEVQKNEHLEVCEPVQKQEQYEEKVQEPQQEEGFEQIFDDSVEEVVLYEVKKHWMNFVVPAFLIPLFFLYFWFIFLNTHSFLSWVITFAILAFIFYPIAKSKSDRMVITNKYIHIKSGVLNPQEFNIPLNNTDMIEVSQTTMGRIFDYGFASYYNGAENVDYGYITSPEDLEYIIENPKNFLEENIG